MRGLVNTYVLDHIERYAYKYSKDHNYLSKIKRESHHAANERLSVSNMFDQIVGISSSSIVAAGLSMKLFENHHSPLYYAKEFIEL